MIGMLFEVAPSIGSPGLADHGLTIRNACIQLYP